MHASSTFLAFLLPQLLSYLELFAHETKRNYKYSFTTIIVSIQNTLLSKSSLRFEIYFLGVGSLHGALLPSLPQVIPESSILLPQHWLFPNTLPSSSLSSPHLPLTAPHVLHFLLQHTALCL